MADSNGAEASASVPAQDGHYAYRSFHEYRWDLDKDFLVSQTHRQLSSHTDQPQSV